MGESGKGTAGVEGAPPRRIVLLDVIGGATYERVACDGTTVEIRQLVRRVTEADVSNVGGNSHQGSAAITASSVARPSSIRALFLLSWLCARGSR